MTLFVTVGSDLPFDRLVRAVDKWAGGREEVSIFAQIGRTELRPVNMEHVALLSPSDFTARFDEADAIVSHAGMGTILNALTRGKPILVMPRRASLQETRNEHQSATVERLKEGPGILVARDETEVRKQLDNLAAAERPKAISGSADPKLLDALHDFISRS